MNQYLKYFLLILAVFSISEVFGQNKFDADSKTVSTEIYAPVDLVFKLKSKPAESPFEVSGSIHSSANTRKWEPQNIPCGQPTKVRGKIRTAF